MAISGLLIHTLTDSTRAVESAVSVMSGLTCYGIHDDCYVVAVAECPLDRLEEVMNGIKALDGVLALYPTYLTVEDELDEKTGRLTSECNVKELFSKTRAGLDQG